MTFNQIKMAFYATYITNYYGYKLTKANTAQEKKRIRTEYSDVLLSKLKLKVKVLNPEKIPSSGQFLLASNHRSVIDPLIIELATQNSTIFGHWISKKELYNSFFFGLFVRNAGTILLDREKSQMGGFFAEIKEAVKAGDSIYIFPEGTRNKSHNELGEFKDGSRLIAVKNRLDILPVYIKTNADKELMSSLKDGQEFRTIEVIIGDIISYKEKEQSLQEAFYAQFNIPKPIEALNE
ncbi:MAG: 1-acyl-sn-glycerol-3-phosphate acyltransferase [Campylobacterales bacterium]|nr:1-acyl-sn-glycerol-3-phosphate acyltransferase [Campylobacterales bacterium]